MEKWEFRPAQNATLPTIRSASCRSSISQLCNFVLGSYVKQATALGNRVAAGAVCEYFHRMAYFQRGSSIINCRVLFSIHALRRYNHERIHIGRQRSLESRDAAAQYLRRGVFASALAESRWFLRNLLWLLAKCVTQADEIYRVGGRIIVCAQM